jgi:hypothetical protein
MKPGLTFHKKRAQTLADALNSPVRPSQRIMRRDWKKVAGSLLRKNDRLKNQNIQQGKNDNENTLTA